MSSSVAVYDREYVESTQRQKNVLCVVLGLIVGMIVYGGWEGYCHIKALKQELDSAHIQLQEESSNAQELQDKLKNQQALVNKTQNYILHVNPSLNRATALSYAKAEIRFAHQYHIPLALGLSQSLIESGWRAKVYSPTGCMGLKQIASSQWLTELHMTKAQLWKPENNIAAGDYVISKHIRQYHSVSRALEAYSGSTDVAINKAYSRKVLTRALAIEKMLMTNTQQQNQVASL